MEKILITGATGKFGNATINFLIKKGIPAGNISALVRDANKASGLKKKGIILKIGDYDNFSSLVSALNGIDKLLLVSGTDIQNRTKQHKNVIDAAKEAGVKHIIYTSFQRKNETETSPIAFIADAHVKTEKWMKESGISYTILKNNLYMEMIPIYVGDKVFETGIIYQPAGEGKAAFVLRDEMAEAAANILITGDYQDNTYDFTAETAWSYMDIAKMLSEMSGKSVKYVSPTHDEFKKTLTGYGVSADNIGFLSSFAEAIKQGEFEKTSTTMEKLLGRRPTTLQSFLKQAYS